MPKHQSLGKVFKLPGFDFGDGPIFDFEDRSRPRDILRCILGEEAVLNRNFSSMKHAFSPALIKLFELAIELKAVFVALRGNETFYETLAARWNVGNPGEVSREDIAAIVKVYVQARCNFRWGSNKDWQLTNLVDQWIQAVDEVALLPPLWTPTVVVAGQINNIEGGTSQLQGDRAFEG